jgi:hypothetical protein
MRVAKQDERTLVIRSGFPLLTSSSLEFDKSSGLGVARKHGLLTDRAVTEFRLSEITDARVFKRQHASGASYTASIMFERDASLHIPGSRRETKTTVIAIRAFLQIARAGGVGLFVSQ